ncbi:LysE family translocator [Pseudosulfitobacter koreensis]|uniref:LysE family transporter n=1 Tax=Pseudosulfitobacter koreensis TaxID=2968472 RepID=A0ABT1YXI4_9RHOB|nr:LysE family transporter [Pseudosulfitobacter koreense]MCR8825596.1 LysE family transporter [Pseudosulfitobacter koreense]
MDIAQAWIIATITWLAVISPGADFAVVSRNSSLFGQRAGLASSVGIASGCFVHIAYAILGLALISQYFPDFFEYVRIVGAGYLIYLGLAMVRSKAEAVQSAQIADQQLSNWRYLRMGLLTNSLNPKTSLFVISLYSQVIGPETPMEAKLFWGVFIAVSHFIWFGAVALFMSAPAIRVRILQNQRAFNIAIGAVLLALGAILLFKNDLGI